MDSFSISQLQQFSGIKAHTIRIWEQRYNALKPGRSEGNTRYYSGEQLRRLLNIVSLLNTDMKISELCALSNEKLNRLIEKQAAVQPTDPEYEFYISQIVAAALEYNEIRFDKVFSNALLRYGLKDAYIYIVYPSLNRLSLMWSTSTLAPAQEHFITGLFRQKFLVAADALPVPTAAAAGKDAWLLFLPEDELHELGLLLANYLLRQAGKKVYYLGPNLPYNSLVAAVKAVKPANLLFFLVRKNDLENDQELLTQISQQFHHLNIYMACDVARTIDLKKPKNCALLHAVDDLLAVLEK
ncbi:MerR family transcriptional regulator [Longitalea luteola]|uniref:MerR family transcriptional regulator n=1 Tax=Longitalea luteola TaxID=2812563 RepID=UPI001A96DD10|nr:MerR family transcriptional regulator [Longitalea luteola]